MAKKYQTSVDWGLTIQEFNTGLWGNPIGTFKVSQDFVNRYALTDTSDLTNVFNQLTTATIQKVVGKMYLLQQTDGITLFPAETQKQLRYWVYSTTANAMLNHLFEKRVSQGISGSTLDISNDVSGWTIPADNISTTDWENLEAIGLDNYKVRDGILYYFDDAYYPEFEDGTRLRDVNLKKATNENKPYAVLTEAATYEVIDNALINSHKQFAGTLLFDNDATLQSLIDTYNQGNDITFVNGTIYNKTEAAPEDVIRFIPTPAAVINGYQAEEATILEDKSMQLWTQNNQLKIWRDAVDALITGMEERKLDKETFNNQAIKVDGSNNFASTYIPNDPKSPIYKEFMEAHVASVKNLITGDNATKTIRNLQDDYQSMSDRITALEGSPNAKYIRAFRTWDGNKALTAAGNSATALTATTTINTLTAEDGLTFNLTAKNTLDLWIVGTATTIGTFELFASVKVGSTYKLVLEAIRDGSGNSLEVLSIQVATDGTITISRNAGNLVDFTTLAIVNIMEPILALAGAFITQDKLDELKTYTDAELLKKLNTNDPQIIAAFGAGTSTLQAILSLKSVQNTIKTYAETIGSKKVVLANGSTQKLEELLDTKPIALKEYVDAQQKVFDLSDLLTDNNIFTELSKLEVGDIFIANDSLELLPAQNGGFGKIARKENSDIFVQFSGFTGSDETSTIISGVWIIGNNNNTLFSKYIDTSKTAKVIEALSGSTITFKDGTTLAL